MSLVCHAHVMSCTWAAKSQATAKELLLIGFPLQVEVEVVTMGCPAAGNAAFVAHYDRVMGSNRTYRITNNADVVPSMLPTFVGCGLR